jgi:hypothetical protein
MYDSMERRTSVGRSSKEEEDEDGGVSFAIFSLSLVDQFSYFPIMDRQGGGDHNIMIRECAKRNTCFVC